VRILLGRLRTGQATTVIQPAGPLAQLGREEMRRMLSPPRTDEAVLAAVRARIEASDVLLACCSCGASRSDTVKGLPKRLACRRCASNQMAVLRPWNEEWLPILRKKTLTEEERGQKARILRNGALVANFGPTAARLLVARGIGPDTAARILQKVADPANPAFWREILNAELQFARTHAFWER
jgi:ATP-dependent Lhr-like helicase